VDSPRPYILVVDDLADAANSMVKLLKVWGYDSEAYYQGDAALEAARTRRPHAVLLDIGMPGMDGFQLARQLRQLSPGERTPVFAITGHSTDQCRTRAREAGIDHYLVKPADLAALQELLATVAGRPAPNPPKMGGASRGGRAAMASSWDCLATG